MVTFPRKTVVAGLTAASLAAFTLASATPAAAAWRGGWGAPVAAGVIGGLALGALAASAARPYYYGPAYAPPPCWSQRQPVYDYYGRIVGYRRIQVCQ